MLHLFKYYLTNTFSKPVTCYKPLCSHFTRDIWLEFLRVIISFLHLALQEEGLVHNRLNPMDALTKLNDVY